MPPLKVGLLVDRDQLPTWQVECVSTLLELPASCLTAVILNRAGKYETKNSSRRTATLSAWYREHDNAKHAPRSGEDPLSLVGLESALEGLEEAPRVTVLQGDVTLVGEVTRAGLDILLDLTVGTPQRDLASLPTLGMWRYDFCDSECSAGLPGFWEVAADEPTIATTLYKVGTVSDGDRVLYRSTGATNRFSVRKTANDQLWKAAYFPARVAKGLRPGEPIPSLGVYERVSRPARVSNARMVAFLARIATRRLVSRIRGALFEEQWLIAYRFDTSTAQRDSAGQATSVIDVVRSGAPGFEVIVPPKDCYWADPFPFLMNDRYYLFFEEVRREDGKGRIVVTELHPDGTYDKPRTVLERPYHLSYPLIFAWRDEIWMIPESGANRTVELYRAVDFPYAWTLDRVLLEDVAACDATLFTTHNQWWMALTVAPGSSDAYWDELHMFYADTPLGPWTPHVNNPVTSSVRGSRPAGRVVVSREGLLRPAQDCSRGYGYAIVLQLIERLDDRHFAERELSTLLPEWHRGLTGTHTINAAGRLVVIDGKMERAKYW